MAVKISIWNSALREIGVAPLSDTGDQGEAKRQLVDAYPGVVEECLSAAGWNFAIKAVQIDGDTGIAPAFGYRYGFTKPTDWVRTTSLSDDPHMRKGLERYNDRQDIWEADADPIYVGYVSNDTGLGLDLAKWPRAFARYVEVNLAHRICERLTQSQTKREDLESELGKTLAKAKNLDAINEAQPKVNPLGSWNASRSSGDQYRGR